MTGTQDDEKKPRGEETFFGPPPPPPPTVRAGLNRYSWDLRYPGATPFEGMIIWSARPELGPKAPPGRYQARVSAAGESQTVSFEIRMDPRLKGVTAADLKEQFELASKIRDRVSQANEAVIRIRKVRDELNARLGKSKDRDLAQAAKALLDKTAAIEQELYQVQNRSNQDPLNFPIKLNNRLASLQRSVETGDARPTDGAYKVLEELSGELHNHLQKLEAALGGELDALNQRLRRLKLEPVAAR